MLSLCLIGKDEAKGLKRLLKSVGKNVDEIILVSTHGDQKLEKKALELGAKVYKEPYPKFHCTNGEFDFASARNSSFDKASGDYILWADLDDVIINADLLPELVKEMKENGIDWTNLTYLYDKDSQGRVRSRQVKPRITRKGTGEWNKTVHECFEPTTAINPPYTDDTIIIDHLKDEEHDNKSGLRNLNILLAEYNADKEKTDPRTLYYIANTYSVLGSVEQALEFYVKFVKVSGSEDDKYFAFHSMVDCFLVLKRYDDMVNCALNMIKIFPNWSLGYFDLGKSYSLKGEYSRSIEWIKIGFSKQKPDTMNFTNDLDYSFTPFGILADDYLQTHKFQEAYDISNKLLEENPDDPMAVELYETCSSIIEDEDFIKSFLKVVAKIYKTDRLMASKMFDDLPVSLDGDIRIQNMRFMTVPPKTWDKKSIVVYCGKGNGEEWAYPSVFKGIGGSEEMVIKLMKILARLGWKPTVYNNCGDLAGTYDGVEYVPYFKLNVKDYFNILIGWRTPSLFHSDVKAKKKLVWLHDIAYPEQFSEKAIENTDKFIFLSKWHRNNMPTIDNEKIYISNNGIEPKEFDFESDKELNTLCWTASYDRGLLPFIENIFPLIVKAIPDVKLRVAYGWDNIDKYLNVPELKELREKLTPILDTHPNIEHLNRISHKDIAKLLKKSQAYVYASEFGETNCISTQKAQLAGCYVISTPQAGAVPEYLIFGETVDGNGIYSDKKQQELYAKKVIEYLQQPKDNKSVLESIVESFSLENTANKWDKELLCD